jgi:hypothetical protein
MSMSSVTWSNNRFSVGPEGYRWQAPGQDRQGPWSDVASVMTFRASAAFGNFQVGAWQHFGVTFVDGRSFKFFSPSKEAYEVAAATVSYTAPLIVPRLRAQLASGAPVSFGDITLTREQLSFRKKSWPLRDIAGHKTYQGCWMMDVGPRSRPSLAVQVMLTKIPNFLGLLSLLDDLIPGREYRPDGPDLGSAWRPSASSHDPRYMSGRTRLMIIGGFLGLAAVGGLGVAYYLHRQDAQYEGAVAELDAEHAALIQIGQSTAVEPGTPYVCDADVPEEDVMYVVHAQPGMPSPSFRDPDSPFMLGASRGPGYREPWLVFAEERDLTDIVESRRTVTYAVRLIDTAKHQVRCQGEMKAAFADIEKYDLDVGLQDALRLIPCGARDDADCADVRKKVELVFPAPPKAEPAAVPAEVAEKPGKAKKAKKRGR